MKYRTDDLLSLEEWENKYKPLQDEEGCEIFYETYGEYIIQLKSKLFDIADKHNTKIHQHVWTRVDGDNGKLILLNGWHACNKLDYCITELPWGDGTDADKDDYIEVTYED